MDTTCLISSANPIHVFILTEPEASRAGVRVGDAEVCAGEDLTTGEDARPQGRAARHGHRPRPLRLGHRHPGPRQ